MAANGDANWQVVSVVVGSEDHAFHVHLQRLGPLVAELDLGPLEEVARPDWDPEVFNLIVNWMYDMPMPRVKNLTQYFNPSNIDPNLPRPDASKFRAVREKRWDFEGSPHLVDDDLNNITAQPMYQKYSTEELRLHFDLNGRDKDTVSTDSSWDASPELLANDSNGEWTFASGQDEEEKHRPNYFSIPSCIPKKEAMRADEGQILLLKVMMFAEEYNWEALFNDASNAFNEGEAQLRRIYLPSKYIDLAFTNMEENSEFLHFIVGYALWLGLKNNKMLTYQELIKAHPEILTLLLASLDLSVPAEELPARQLNSSSDYVPTRYHMHRGGIALGCKCKTIMRSDSPPRNPVLPFPLVDLS
ncbi:hypothetical protein F4777DRAFT_550841 [Nemania sp. FL0916]|nr:hypothetical protein F4777DRAFT_550841 [Nemania sp. FL0916]